MEGLLQLFGLIVLVMIPIMFFAGKKKKEEIGAVTCRRCGHEGEIKAEFRPFKGNVLMCEKCGSEDWTKKKA